MTKYQRAAAKAIADRLRGQTEPLTLYTLSCTADTAAREAGKKGELYPSLFDYADLLPGGWRGRWLKSEGSGPNGDSLYMACPPNWQEGRSDSQQLLLGAGKLVTADNPYD